MSQLPQNNEAFDYNPEYAKLYQANDSYQSESDDTDEWQQPSDVPTVQDGKRAANLSLLFSFLGPLSFFLGFWLAAHNPEGDGLQLALVAPVLNILGIWQGFAARRRGTRATGGLVLNGLGLCFFIGIVALIMMILNALSHIH